MTRIGLRVNSIGFGCGEEVGYLNREVVFCAGAIEGKVMRSSSLSLIIKVTLHMADLHMEDVDEY